MKIKRGSGIKMNKFILFYALGLHYLAANLNAVNYENKKSCVLPVGMLSLLAGVICVSLWAICQKEKQRLFAANVDDGEDFLFRKVHSSVAYQYTRS